MRKILVGSSQTGQGGNIAGVIELENLYQLKEEEKVNKVKEENVQEIAFIERIDAITYEVEYYSSSQRILACGHASLAIGKYLNSSRPVKLLTDSGELTVLKNGEDFELIQPRNCLNIQRKGINSYFCEEQEKLLVHMRRDHESFKTKEVFFKELASWRESISCEPPAVLYFAKSGPERYVVSFYRDGKEDPCHISGLYPVLQVISAEGSEAQFTYRNGSSVTAKNEKGYISLLARCEVLGPDNDIIRAQPRL